MIKRIFFVFLSLFLVTNAFCVNGYIRDVVVDNQNDVLSVKVDVGPKGAYSRCIFYTSDGRKLEEGPIYVIGEETMVFVIPPKSKAYQVGLWREKYKYRTGPDLYNIFAKVHGYYLWGKIDEERGAID